MSIPHVTSRGTKRESRPPTLWETLQEGNLSLQRQCEAPVVNMFFKLFISLLSCSYPTPLHPCLSFCTSNSLRPRNGCSMLSRSNLEHQKCCGRTVGARRTTDNHRTFHSLLLPCNICKMLLFPTTPPPATNLHPRAVCTNRCRRMRMCNHDILHLCSGFQLRLQEVAKHETIGRRMQNGSSVQLCP